MAGRLWQALVLALVAAPVLAEAPATSPRPMPRPAPVAALATAEAAVTAPAPAAIPRPRARPSNLVTAAMVPQAPPLPVSAVHPRARPADLMDNYLPASAAAPLPEPDTNAKQKSPKRGKATKRGSVCGDPAIRGEKLAPITSKVKGCGVEAPVRVTEIDGIRLSQPITVNCDTATALRQWIDKGMRPAFGKRRQVVELHIAAHYICRPRNNKKGAKISEHGRGRAIDIAGFTFADGTRWSVAGDYNKDMRKAHKAACGIFGTTLGPGSDGYHEDHLHFDTADYRSGPYCR